MRALITGAQGQDGRLLTQLLGARGFEVLGIARPGGRNVVSPAIRRDIDLTDERAIGQVVTDYEPDHVYHLAACHHSSEQCAGVSLEREMIATNFRAVEVLITTIATRRPDCRVLIAGSSQMYRAPTHGEMRVDESTPMEPATFYGWTKKWARELGGYYRANRNVFASTAILFNHESVLRPPSFVTRKVTMAAARAKLGQDPELHLFDVASRIDWSSAVDAVEGMVLALSAPEPADYVFASGETRTVQDVLEVAFGAVGLEWRAFATVRERHARSGGSLVGDPTRAGAVLGWKQKVGFEAMIREMVEHDLTRAQAGRSSKMSDGDDRAVKPTALHHP